jgi:hypothetical protein
MGSAQETPTSKSSPFLLLTVAQPTAVAISSLLLLLIHPQVALGSTGKGQSNRSSCLQLCDQLQGKRSEVDGKTGNPQKTAVHAGETWMREFVRQEPLKWRQWGFGKWCKME